MAVGVATFIVLQGQSAEASRREKARLLNLAHDAILVRGPDDVITDWNRGATGLYGWTAQEAVGRATRDLLKTVFPAPIEAIDAELQGAGRWEGELIRTRRDGTEVVVASRWALQRDRKGRPIVILETSNDITERRRAEQLTGAVFENSPDGISIVGQDYRYRRVNPVYERLWKLPAERFIGMHVSELLGTEAFERAIKPNVDRCFAGEVSAFTGWWGDRGGRLYLAITFSPLRLGSEPVEAALVITHDLTDHMEASEALQVAQAELSHVARMSTLGELSASIAHEINQPLAAIVTGAAAGLRWLDVGSPNLEEMQGILTRIHRDGNRAAEVISRIRALARKTPIRMGRLALNDVILDVIALTRGEMDRKRIALGTRLADDLPAIHGDRVQLQQVILNLIVNAIEAMHDCDPRELRVSSRKDEAEDVLVSVCDTGPGLHPQTIDRIFESFFTTKPGGMGMGLSICRSIIETHGGRLAARANPPRGAIFEIALPRDHADTMATQTDASAAPTTG